MSEKKSSPGMWTPANIVTSVRVVFVPVWLLMAQLLGGVGVGGMAVFVAFCLLSLTDKLDGYLARSRNEVTTFGKFLDPIADKIMVATVILVLAAQGVLDGVGGFGPGEAVDLNPTGEGHVDGACAVDH